MELMDKVIINSAINKWWTDGQSRLVKSLYDTGFSGDILHYTNEPINDYYKKENPYTTKAAALHEAIKRGYRYILWLDCSLWAIKNVDPFFDTIKENNGYFMKSGFNCAQTTNDHAAKISGYTHDELEKLEELWSCIFGFDMQNDRSKKCAELFLEYCKDGVFEGNRKFVRSECRDRRFLFSRQDQTALSLAYHKSGITTLFNPNTHIIQDANGIVTEKTYFKMRGM